MARFVLKLTLLTTLALGPTGHVAVALEAPDSEFNEANGTLETAYVRWVAGQPDVSYLIEEESSRTIEVVSDSTTDDLSPRLAIGSSGDAWVTWWRDTTTEQVLVRKRDGANGTWGSERLVSETDEASTNPVIVHDGTDPWVAYQYASASATGIAVGYIIDEPDPIGTRATLATTTYNGSVDVTISSEDGHLWVTWVDSATHVGWSEYDYVLETWSSPSLEDYSGDSIEDARDRIETTVLAP